MPVSTPQLEEPVFGGGIATQQGAAEATPPMATGETPQALPPGAGFVSKKGAGAYVANSIINGWLKGRQIASVRNMQNAQNELGTARHSYDVLAQNYKNIAEQKGEDSPEAQKARAAAVLNWNEYNQIRAKYVIPQDQGKKGSGKSKGEQFKGALGSWAGQMFGKSGVQPHMIAEMAIKSAQDHPENLDLNEQDRLAMQQMEQTKTATELGKEQLADAKAARKLREEKEADDEKMKAIVSKPAIDRTPADQQWLDGYERVQHINDPEAQKMADSVLKKIEAGTQLSDTDRNFAYSQKLLQGPQSIQYQDGLNTYVAMQNPDGTITNRVKLGRVFHEDEAAVAVRQQRMLHELKVGEFKRSGMSDKDAEQAATLEEARNPALVAQFIGNNPVAEAKQKDALSKALKTVYANAGGLGADKATRDAAQARMSNFISGDPKGAASYLLFRNQVASPTGTTGWYNKQNTYAGGLTQDKLAAEQAALWDQVRQTLHEQNPNMSPMDLDAAMPEYMKTPEGQPPAGAQQGGQQSSGGKQINDPPPEGESLLSKVGDVLTAPAKMYAKAGGAAIDAGKYLLSKPSPDQNANQVKGKDGFYGTKTEDTKEYRVKTADGWVKYHMTDDAAKNAKDNGFEIQPITMSSLVAQ